MVVSILSNIKLLSGIMDMDPLIFFVYPDPKGSEEPSTQCELDVVKINLLPLRLRVAASAKQGWGWGK
jgi:hypothetical protein